jgi:hypothetical protein
MMSTEKSATISSNIIQYALIGCSVALYLGVPYTIYVVQPLAWLLCVLVIIGTIAITATALALYASSDMVKITKNPSPTANINTINGILKSAICILSTLVVGLQLKELAPILSDLLIGCSVAQLYSSIVARIMVWKVKQWSNLT